MPEQNNTSFDEFKVTSEDYDLLAHAEDVAGANEIEAPKSLMRKLGEFGVDSGTFVIGDMIYVTGALQNNDITHDQTQLMDTGPTGFRYKAAVLGCLGGDGVFEVIHDTVNDRIIIQSTGWGVKS